MSRPLLRLLARLAGLALIGVVVWIVGLDDRVTGADGDEHHGTITHHEPPVVRLRDADGAETTFRDPARVRYGLRTPFRTLADRPGWVLLAALVQFVSVVVTFRRWSAMLAGAGVATPWRDVFRLGYVGQFFGCVVPGGVAGGDVMKAVYLTRHHPERKTRAVLAVVADRVVALGVLAAIAAAGVAAAPGLPAGARPLVLALFAAAAAGAALFVFPRLRAVLRVDAWLRAVPFPRFAAEMRAALALYAGRPRVLGAAALWALLAHALLLTAFALFGAALGDPLPWGAVLVAIPAAQVLSAVPGLPGGWGVGDAAYLLLLPAAGVPAGQAVALSFTYRAVHTLLSAPGGLMLVRSQPKGDHP